MKWTEKKEERARGEDHRVYHNILMSHRAEQLVGQKFNFISGKRLKL